jgi:alginate O-acetyltransferase complex protein AlgI
MSLWQLCILAALAFLVGQLRRGKDLALLGVSALLMYWLQPVQEQVSLTYWLPTATLVLTCLAWFLTSTPEVRGWRQNLPAAMVLLGVVVLMDLNRTLQFESIFITATPRPLWLGVLVVAVGFLALVIARARKFSSLLYFAAAIGLICLFVLIKVPAGWSMLLAGIAAIRGKEVVGFTVISWLGFSYVAFRLLHTIFDRKAGRLAAVPLAAYVNYVIFFPSFTAGPIDWLERFRRDLCDPLPLDRAGWLEAGTRLFTGLFKKFVVADALAWIALNDVYAAQVDSSVWMWVLLYSYSLRIYFDFSGYTDIAIGLGRLLGVRLPNNFSSPYLKPNLTQFWNSWHITLTKWFRSYFFNPLIRALRSSKPALPVVLIVLLAQVSTMVLIGLWHGVTASFVLWGLWHGAGLFVQNRWSEYMKSHTPAWASRGPGAAILKGTDILLTFHFVTLGWLFFALSTPAKVWDALAVLFGAA